MIAWIFDFVNMIIYLIGKFVSTYLFRIFLFISRFCAHDPPRRSLGTLSIEISPAPIRDGFLLFHSSGDYKEFFRNRPDCPKSSLPCQKWMAAAHFWQFSYNHAHSGNWPPNWPSYHPVRKDRISALQPPLHPVQWPTSYWCSYTVDSPEIFSQNFKKVADYYLPGQRKRSR